jgi:hypothetical protein
MLRKLYSLVHQNGCKPDDPDSPMMQEILLPGHLYLGVLSVWHFCFKSEKIFYFLIFSLKGKNSTIASKHENNHSDNRF